MQNDRDVVLALALLMDCGFFFILRALIIIRAVANHPVHKSFQNFRLLRWAHLISTVRQPIGTFGSKLFLVAGSLWPVYASGLEPGIGFNHLGRIEIIGRIEHLEFGSPSSLFLSITPKTPATIYWKVNNEVTIDY
jgi:hypothetical protein